MIGFEALVLSFIIGPPIYIGMALITGGLSVLVFYGPRERWWKVW